jgi:hypothetical protein
VRLLRVSRALALLLAASTGAGCKVADSRAWNLNEIHDEATHHRYTGRIEGETEYFWRHEVAGSLAVGGAKFEDKTPVAVPDPATTCLENLIALEDYGDQNPRTLGMQIEWASRLAAADPWRLTRERAAYMLGRAGKKISAGIPTGLPEGSHPSGPDAVSEALAGLLRASRPALDHGSRMTATEKLDLDSACQVVAGMTLDLDGARRLLHASFDLVAAIGSGKPAAASIAELALELERRCIRFALADALKDPDPTVRASAVDAAVRCAGPDVLDPILLQLDNEASQEVVVRVCELVREVGLPQGTLHGTISGAQPTPEQAQMARLGAIYKVVGRPEGWVRVSAMRTLGAVSGAGFQSLREEDWQAWWTALTESRKP